MRFPRYCTCVSRRQSRARVSPSSLRCVAPSSDSLALRAPLYVQSSGQVSHWPVHTSLHRAHTSFHLAASHGGGRTALAQPPASGAGDSAQVATSSFQVAPPSPSPRNEVAQQASRLTARHVMGRYYRIQPRVARVLACRSAVAPGWRPRPSPAGRRPAHSSNNNISLSGATCSVSMEQALSTAGGWLAAGRRAAPLATARRGSSTPSYPHRQQALCKTLQNQQRQRPDRPAGARPAPPSAGPDL